MIVFGASASSCAAKCEKYVFSRNIEVTITTVPAGTTAGPPILRRRIWVCCYAIFSLPHSKLVPSVQMQCRTTATLRATATLAFLAPTRFINRMPHAFNADQRCVRCSKTLAASNK